MSVVLQVLLTSAISFPFSVLDAWDAVASAQLAVRIKAMRDAGDPTTMVELARTYPDPPEGRNAAAFYNAAFAKMDEAERNPEPLNDLLPIVGTAKLPDPDLGLPPAMLKAIREYLGRNAEVLELLRKAAALDECKFQLDFTKGPGMLLPHLAKLRQAARLFALEALERTESGKPDAAADSLVACLRLGGAIRREPVLISTLVRIACDAIAVGQIERWAGAARPSPKALERLQHAAAAEADREVIEGAMLGERCFGMDIYQTYVLKPGGGRMMEAMGGDAAAFGFLARVIPKAYFKSDMVCYIDIMNEYLAAARKPYPEGYLAGARVGRRLGERIPSYFFISRMILPALGRVFQEAQKHVARCESARVGLAALRYKAKHGRLPATLQNLAPDFVDAVPADPFDGKPLRFRKDAEGFAVYAIGEDGKDDGGLTERRDGKQPDVGFRVRWPRAQF